MTETEWLACTDFNRLLEFVFGWRKSWWSRLAESTGLKEQTQLPRRKLQLFACACCRNNETVKAEPSLEKAVCLIERSTDGLIDTEELLRLDDDLLRIIRNNPLSAVSRPAIAVRHATFLFHREGPGGGYTSTYSLHQNALDAAWESLFIESENDPREGVNRVATDLLRHIFGNPFRQYPTTSAANVLQLADAIYNGNPCSFALHDALLESGHPDLAEHFRDPKEWHPKGCWALDLILGKS